jgi:hypothetical protein
MKQSASREEMIQFIIEFYYNDLGWVDLEESECYALNMLSNKSTKQLKQLFTQLNN